MWLFDLCFPQYCKSDMSRYGNIEVVQRVPWTSRKRESTVFAKPCVLIPLLSVFGIFGYMQTLSTDRWTGNAMMRLGAKRLTEFANLAYYCLGIRWKGVFKYVIRYETDKNKLKNNTPCFILQKYADSLRPALFAVRSGWYSIVVVRCIKENEHAKYAGPDQTAHAQSDRGLCISH